MERGNQRVAICRREPLARAICFILRAVCSAAWQAENSDAKASIAPLSLNRASRTLRWRAAAALVAVAHVAGVRSDTRADEVLLRGSEMINLNSI
jgi:hypothetical protein